ncbi:MAG: sterol desaturase family protein [Flavobacteriales bacterium]|nr:sterol desaturase family protein [Flavobacteriales bacterium]
MSERKRLFVSNRNESPKMFENKFLDFFSRIHFTSVPILFVPITGYFIYRSAFEFGVSWPIVAALAFSGYAFWTLMEYCIHRFFFHKEFTTPIGKKIHYIAHGLHHDYPNDSLRLVMPPAINLTLAVLFYWAFYVVIMDKGLTAGFFAGFTFGYMIYDLMHFATHFFNFKNMWFQRIKRSHLLHHYREPNSGFGLSTIFWDRVFGTMHPPEVMDKVNMNG